MLLLGVLSRLTIFVFLILVLLFSNVLHVYHFFHFVLLETSFVCLPALLRLKKKTTTRYQQQ